MTQIGLFALMLISCCAATAEALPAGTHTFSVTVGSTTRPYILHVPKQTAGKPMPVVIMLHGAGGSAAGAAKDYGWIRKADEAGFLAIFPEGTPTHQDRS